MGPGRGPVETEIEGPTDAGGVDAIEKQSVFEYI